MEFPNRDNLKALTTYHKLGGELHIGMNVVLERNYRSVLLPAILSGWKINEVANDISGYSKYTISTCNVEINGKLETWPFTMIYVNN